MVGSELRPSGRLFAYFLPSILSSCDTSSSIGSASLGVIIDSNPSTSGSTSGSFASWVVFGGVGLGVDLDIGTSNEAGLYPGALLCKSSYLLCQPSMQ